MKNKITQSILLILVSIALVSFDLPNDWFKAGSIPNSYDMGIDKGAGQNGTNAATIKSKYKKLKGFGTLMQNCSPKNYLGKRVRMTGYLKTKEVKKWSGFWFRIDQANSKQSLGFDNMHDGKADRSIKGTTKWTKYEIVLDIPDNASNLAYGALLVGTGQIWFDDITFEIVDKSVPTTGEESGTSRIKSKPQNLDFEN